MITRCVCVNSLIGLTKKKKFCLGFFFSFVLLIVCLIFISILMGFFVEYFCIDLFLFLFLGVF